MSKFFIFRNNTVEFFFGNKDVVYSGYDDISVVPDDALNYVWFYQVSIKADTSQLADEIDTYSEKLNYVLNHIPEGKRFIVFFLSDIYSLQYVGNDFRIKESVARFNHAVIDIAAQNSNVKVLDLDDFLCQYPCSEWIDWKYYFISQQIFNPRLAMPFKKWFSRKLEEFDLKRKKCLVLDLDNTLWGGVLGEDGIDGIKIGGDYPGKAFLFFQKALLQLSHYGVILSVCSKNNEADVLEAWDKNPFMALKKKDISAYRINWNNKADNIVELSKELNIGLDSMVFVDDNPAERELVKQALPTVAVPDFPEHPYELPVFFRSILDKYFRIYSVTAEDLKKTEQYRANAARSREKSHFANMSDFLRSLDMKLAIHSVDSFTLPRIAQMTQKTNQFNLTTRRYTEEEIKAMIKDGCRIWSLSVSDRFGDNGITGLIIFRGDVIDELLLSCRILGRGIEFVFVKFVLGLLKKESGYKKIYAKYIPTSKNSQVKNFYEQCGFTLKSDKEGIKYYEIDLDNANFKIKDYYEIALK